MNNTVIPETSLNKHLCLYFSSNCSWKEHIAYICDNSWTRLNLLRSFKFIFKRQALEKMYISSIRPLLEYSDSVWDNCTQDDKTQLVSIHTEAAGIITGATKLRSIEKLYSGLGWETLQERKN